MARTADSSGTWHLLCFHYCPGPADPARQTTRSNARTIKRNDDAVGAAVLIELNRLHGVLRSFENSSPKTEVLIRTDAMRQTGSLSELARERTKYHNQTSRCTGIFQLFRGIEPVSGLQGLTYRRLGVHLADSNRFPKGR